MRWFVGRRNLLIVRSGPQGCVSKDRSTPALVELVGRLGDGFVNQLIGTTLIEALDQ